MPKVLWSLKYNLLKWIQVQSLHKTMSVIITNCARNISFLWRLEFWYFWYWILYQYTIPILYQYCTKTVPILYQYFTNTVPILYQNFTNTSKIKWHLLFTFYIHQPFWYLGISYESGKLLHNIIDSSWSPSLDSHYHAAIYWTKSTLCEHYSLQDSCVCCQNDWPWWKSQMSCIEVCSHSVYFAH